MQSLKKALLDANLELYGEDASAFRLAERHRYHLMDAGVDVAELDGAYRVGFTARAQRSDFPHVEPARIFAAIRSQFGASAAERGYDVDGESVHEVADPVDATKILDVWYEARFCKRADTIEAVIDEVRWALSVEKYVRSDS